MIDRIIDYVNKYGVVSLNELSREFNIDKDFLLYIIKIIEMESNYKIHLLNSFVINSNKCSSCPMSKKIF